MLTPRRNEAASIFRNLDWPIIFIYLAMVLMGMVSIYAASYDFDNASIFSFDEFSGKQLRWILLSLVVGVIILFIDAHIYETYAYPIFILVLIVLLITPYIAHDIKGSKSWISLGPMSLQPAEFAKFATALALAKLFSGYQFLLNARWTNYLKAFAIIFIPVLLILNQKETGSALTFMALFFVLYREGMSGMVLLAALLAVIIFVMTIKFSETMILGIPTGMFIVIVLTMVVIVGVVLAYARRYEVARNLIFWFAGSGIAIAIINKCGVEIPGLPVMLGIIAIASIYIIIQSLKSHRPKLLMGIVAAIFCLGLVFSVNFVFFNILQPHQQQRINVVLGKIEDLRGDGYNVNQSKIAIGSGGFFGKGFLNGTQTKLKYVPEQHTDFIFCTIGEEEGFIGSLAVTLLFLALILRIIRIGERQISTFSRVYAYCVASFFIFHFCINIGMVIGLCPVIGIPLPFFSYGGSSLWGFTILLFILLKLDAARTTR